MYVQVYSSSFLPPQLLIVVITLFTEHIKHSPLYTSITAMYFYWHFHPFVTPPIFIFVHYKFILSTSITTPSVCLANLPIHFSKKFYISLFACAMWYPYFDDHQVRFTTATSLMMLLMILVLRTAWIFRCPVVRRSVLAHSNSDTTDTYSGSWATIPLVSLG